jgi:hypothetical protein
VKRVSAFLDTVVFLHYQPVEQINWREVLRADEVVLTVAPVVIRELDRHKDGQNTTKRSKERARKVAGRLRNLWAEGPDAVIGEGVTIRYIVHEPRVDFSAHGLSRDWQDDQLLASIIDARQHGEAGEMVLVTRDVGPELRARHHGIGVVRLPERLELQEEPDPSEKRIRELERDLNEARNAMPKLDLRFTNGENRLVLRRPEPVSTREEWIARQVAEIRERHPKRGPAPAEAEPDPEPGTLGALVAGNVELSRVIRDFGIQPEQLERHNKGLDAFYAAWERYLRDTIEHQARKKRTYRIDLELVNTGTAPADDIDVFLHFPDGFDLLEEEDLPEEPGPPRPPREPRTPMQMALEGMSMPMSSYLDPSIYRPSFPGVSLPGNVSGPRIRRTNSYDVEVSVRRLKHALSERFDAMYVVFNSPEDVRPFRIDYRINAANAPRESTGPLHVHFGSA